MEQTAIGIQLPSDLAGEVEQFVAQHPADVSAEKAPPGSEAAGDLGFEPITTVAVTAWLLKFAAGAASSLASKFLVDRILKRLNSSNDKLTEVQIAFPSGYVLTVKSGAGLTAGQLRQLIKDNIQ
jgi:hypothetical protein